MGVSRYAYVGNNPLNMTDPTGMCGQMHPTEPGLCRINPDPDGDGQNNITFQNDDPNSANPQSTDQYYQEDLANMIEQAVVDTGYDININSGVRTATAPAGTNSNHADDRANAVDINRINGGRVLQGQPDSAPLSEVAAFQDALANSPDVRANFGPTRNEKTYPNGATRDVSNATMSGPNGTRITIAQGHQNHIHTSSNACPSAGACNVSGANP